jgi:gas vesicle protein
MRAIGFLVVLTIVGFGIYMIVSPSNPRGPSGEDVKRETSDALRTTKDFTKAKADQLKEDTKDKFQEARDYTKEKAHDLKEATKENYQTAKKEVKKAFGSDFSYNQKEAYRRELETQMEDWRQKAHDLENKLIQEGKKQEYYSKIESLKNTQQELSKKIGEIPSVSQDRWDEFQSEVSDKMSSLENSYNDLADKAARTGR